MKIVMAGNTAMFQTLADFKTQLLAVQKEIRTVVPHDIESIVTDYLPKHEGISIMIDMMNSAKTHNEIDMVGFTAHELHFAEPPWVYRGGMYIAFLYEEGEDSTGSDPITLLDGQAACVGLDIYEDVMEAAGYINRQLLAARLSLLGFWRFLSEEESPLKYLLQNAVGADRAGSLRHVFRSQYRNFAVRRMCARAAALHYPSNATE